MERETPRRPRWLKMATGSVSPIYPRGTVAIAASDVSASATLPSPGDTVLVTNATDALAFVALGPIASTANLPVPPGAQILLGAGAYATQVAVILAAGATPDTVYATCCDGTER